MGAYLSEPVTEKYSTDETRKHLSYGASSMQGWRTSQEDAHNCIADFDTNTSFFAVYDGHGGAEVAQYCAMHLPEYLKELPSYKAGNIAQALEDTFLGFDSSLTEDHIIGELKRLAGVSEVTSDAECDELDNLCAEASMPLEELLAKYRSGSVVLSERLSKLKESKKPQSPFLRAKNLRKTDKQEEKSDKMDENSAAGNSNHINGEKDEDDKNCEHTKYNKSTTNTNKNSDVDGAQTFDDGTSEGSGPLDSDKKNDCGDQKICEETDLKKAKKSEEIASASSSKQSGDANGTDKLVDAEPGCSSKSSSSSSSFEGPRKSKEIASSKNKDESMESDESDSEDETYQENSAESDSEEDNEEDDGEEEEDEDDDEEEEEEEEGEDDDDGENDKFEEEDRLMQAKEEPGSDSGCTAVVAVFRGNELYVANAGDSRCVISRKGKAIEMSSDHKPEELMEMQRIINAGGNVTRDGRVNGGLNLSRAIGDHTYKRNKELPLKDQMISAMPDIRTLTVNPEEDEFMIVACDGIWNYMNSQEVVDYVHSRLDKNRDKLSVICEELFDHCLAPHTRGDGTGCDNMTAIIVLFHKAMSDSTKRSSTSGTEELANDDSGPNEAKKIKLGDDR